MSELILIRHGESLWNLDNRFTGWVDIPLSQKGVEEAFIAGNQLKQVGFDIIYTSTLIRAIQTAMFVMLQNSYNKVPVIQNDEKDSQNSKIYDPFAKKKIIPVIKAWQLNERCYGELQGFSKDATREKYGDEQVKIWRRSYAVAPPKGESLQLTAERTIPYFQKEILYKLESGKNILVVAHGNSLRSIVMDLDQLSEKEVLDLEIKTGAPIHYRYEKERFARIK